MLWSVWMSQTLWCLNPKMPLQTPVQDKLEKIKIESFRIFKISSKTNSTQGQELNWIDKAYTVWIHEEQNWRMGKYYQDHSLRQKHNVQGAIQIHCSWGMCHRELMCSSIYRGKSFVWEHAFFKLILFTPVTSFGHFCFLISLSWVSCNHQVWGSKMSSGGFGEVCYTSFKY